MKRSIAIFALLCAITVTVFAASARAEERLVVTLHETIYSTSRIVRLSEVALIESKNVDLVKKAGTATLGRLPRGVVAMQVTKDRISERLRWTGISGDDFIITGASVSIYNGELVEGESVLAKPANATAKDQAPALVAKTDESVATSPVADAPKPVETLEERDERVLPKRQAEEQVSLESLIEAARLEIIEEVYQASGIDRDLLVVETTLMNTKLRLLQRGDFELLNVTSNKTSMTPFGTRAFNLTIRNIKQIEKDYILTVKISHRMKVAVALRTVAAREGITEDDVRFEERLFETTSVGDLITSFEDLRNMAPISTLTIGEAINRARLQKAIVVQQGDRIEFTPAGPAGAFFGGTYGIAKRSGSVGDEIFVEYDVDTLVPTNPGNKDTGYTKRVIKQRTLVRITDAGKAEAVSRDGK